MEEHDKFPSFKWTKDGNYGCGCEFERIDGTFDHERFVKICKEHLEYYKRHEKEWPYNSFIYHNHLPKELDVHPPIMNFKDCEDGRIDINISIPKGIFYEIKS